MSCPYPFPQRKFANHLATIGSASNNTAYSERDIDLLSALQLSERALFGATTAQRILIARLALSVADPTAIFTAEHLDIVSDRLGRIEALLELRQLLHRRPDQTFVYWHQAILAGCVKQVQLQAATSADAGSGDGAKAKPIFHSPTQSVHFLARFNTNSSIDGCDDLTAAYRIDVGQLFRTTFVARLCSHIENNLRLFVHNYMHDTPASDSNANAATSATVVAATTAVVPATVYKSEATVSDEMLRLLALRPLPLNGRHFVFRNHIQHYLSRTFYNLTAVSLSDGRTYGEMRSLARIKYGLTVVEDQLPSETLEQGLDVLDVMRCMDDFVSEFVYDMNSQVFIQATSGNNFLNTMSVAHVVN